MKILIIDDEKRICEAIKNTLNFFGLNDITYFCNALEGEKELHKNIYDIVILDLIMPKKHGVDILKAAKLKGIISEFIVLTAISDIQMVVDCLKAGAFNYIVKPPKDELIVETVKSAYEHNKLKNNLEIFTTNKEVALPPKFKKIFTKDNNFKKILLGYAHVSTNCFLKILL
jgi:DNA-binding NtrC family response regulator